MQEWLDELVGHANSVLSFLQEEISKNGSSLAPRSIRAIQSGINARNRKNKLPADLSLPKIRGALVYLVLIDKRIGVTKIGGDWLYYVDEQHSDRKLIEDSQVDR